MGDALGCRYTCVDCGCFVACLSDSLGLMNGVGNDGKHESNCERDSVGNSVCRVDMV